MMKLWKRNAVVSVVVLFVFVALYLSWAYGRPGETGDDATVFDPGSLEQDAGDVSGSEDDEMNPALEAEVDDTESVGNYFDEARLSRMKSRDSALSILTEATERASVSQDVRDNASVEIGKLVNNAMAETAMENLIIAKGFAECVVIINQEGVKVIVAEPTGGMTEDDAAKVLDVVLGEYSVSLMDIRIVPVAV